MRGTISIIFGLWDVKGGFGFPHTDLNIQCAVPHLKFIVADPEQLDSD